MYTVLFSPLCTLQFRRFLEVHSYTGRSTKDLSATTEERTALDQPAPRGRPGGRPEVGKFGNAPIGVPLLVGSVVAFFNCRFCYPTVNAFALQTSGVACHLQECTYLQGLRAHWTHPSDPHISALLSSSDARHGCCCSLSIAHYWLHARAHLFRRKDRMETVCFPKKAIVHLEVQATACWAAVQSCRRRHGGSNNLSFHCCSGSADPVGVVHERATSRRETNRWQFCCVTG